MQFNSLDYVLMAFMLLSLVVGAWRGLLFEVVSLLGWVVAFFAAGYLQSTVLGFLPQLGLSPALMAALAWVVAFVATLFAWGLLAWLVKKLMSASAVRGTDRALGLIFGAIRGALLVLLFAWFVSASPLAGSPWWQKSALRPWLAEGVAAVKAQLKPEWLPNFLSQSTGVPTASPSPATSPAPQPAATAVPSNK